MTFVPEAFPIQPGPHRSPPRGAAPIRAYLFDTYGTVCDFYRPLARGFDRLARAKNVACDAGRLAIEWRNAYARSTFMAAGFGMEFRPLKEIHRDNLMALAAEHFPAPLDDADLDAMVSLWNALDPWPDVIEGLCELKKHAVIAPLSNGNFDDMIALARHARLPWDAIVGSSIARAYKPHPDIYLRSVEALNLRPENVCMVAAHQVDLAYAAGHGMQTAFVIRRDEFGGAVKPEQPEPGFDGLSAAEIHAEGDWTFVAESFVDLAASARL
jgi:2-haloacid dehalogenase